MEQKQTTQRTLGAALNPEEAGREETDHDAAHSTQRNESAGPEDSLGSLAVPGCRRARKVLNKLWWLHRRELHQK